jgi:hypothetical protein
MIKLYRIDNDFRLSLFVKLPVFFEFRRKPTFFITSLRGVIFFGGLLRDDDSFRSIRVEDL